MEQVQGKSESYMCFVVGRENKRGETGGFAASGDSDSES